MSSPPVPVPVPVPEPEPGHPVPPAAELAALAARLGFRLDDDVVDVLRAAVVAAEPAVARLRARPPAADGAADPAHGDRWLRP